MKRLLLPSILFLLAIANGFSQNAPKKFNYQAVARNSDGTFLVSKPCTVIVTLTDNLTKTYTETHIKNTNKYGLFSLEIGAYSTAANDISSLNWTGGKVTISINVNGTPIGSGVELLSVPYAFYADNAFKAEKLNSGGTSGKNIFGGKGITIDSSKTGILTINSTLDSSYYIKLDKSTYPAGNYILVNDGQKNWTVQTITATGGGIKEINGDTTLQQTFVLDTASTVDLAIVDDLKGKHTIGLPVLKSTSTSTAGLLSKADYDKLDSLDFRRLRRLGIADGSVIIFNGTIKKWEVKPLSGTISTGKGLIINNNKITLNIDSTTIDTSGTLSVKHIDPSKIKTTGAAENQILKVQSGKLIFVADSAIQYKSKSLVVDNIADTIELKPGTTPGDVMTWDGKVWTPQSSVGNGWSLTGNTGTKAGVNYIGTNDAVGFKIKTNKVTKMTIDATGNVLFGKSSADSLTTNPRAAFEQRGTVGATAAIFGGDTKGVGLIANSNFSGIGFNQYFNGASKVISSGFSGYISLLTGNGDLLFGISSTPNANADSAANGGTNMILTKDGKLGIGTPNSSSISHQLTVANTSDSNNVQFSSYARLGKKQLLYVDANGVVRDTSFSAVSGSAGWNLTGNFLADSAKGSNQFIGCSDNAPLIFKTNNSIRMQIGRSGNVGIGQLPTTGYALAVNGKIKTSNITESSDIRYKKNIQPISNALDKVQKLTGVSYIWRQSDFPEMNFEKGTDLGLIAQEVEKVLPELVNTDEKGYKSVEYSHLVSVLVEAIKEQQKQIETLKVEVSVKESKVQDSESRIKTLESSVSTLSSQMQLLLELTGKTEGIKASK